MDADDHIRAAWRAAAGTAHDDVVERVLVRHREPHRRYHTAEHVAAVLRHLDALTTGATDPTLVAAALFHDAIYDPRSSANEAESARLAIAELRTIGWSSDRCRTAARLIEATATHHADHDDEAVMLDADLAILGASPAEYERYSRAVRSEYAHVSDEAWREGRAAVLRSFLDRAQIFATPAMRDQRELRARQNLGRELESLRDAG